MAAIGVRKSYGEVKALDGVSLEARPGEIFGLIGPNGAGKSTMIKIIMNVLAPDSGEVTFDGERLSARHRDRLGYLPEERGLYKKLKVRESLEYLGELKGMRRRDAVDRGKALLARFGLEDRMESKIETLSKGMAQKVQLACALVHDPDAILFDEPFSGLDPVSQEEALALMLEMRDSGKAVIFSTHVMEHAERICGRLALIDRGREVVSGTVADVKAAYGKHSVTVEYDGDASFVSALPFVTEVMAMPRRFEATLAEGVDADELYKALAGRIRVREFKAMDASLLRVFTALVRRELSADEMSDRGEARA